MNMGSLFPAFEHLQPQSIRNTVPQIHQVIAKQLVTNLKKFCLLNSIIVSVKSIDKMVVAD